MRANALPELHHRSRQPLLVPITVHMIKRVHDRLGTRTQRPLRTSTRGRRRKKGLLFTNSLSYTELQIWCNMLSNPVSESIVAVMCCSCCQLSDAEPLPFLSRAVPPPICFVPRRPRQMARTSVCIYPRSCASSKFYATTKMSRQHRFPARRPTATTRSNPCKDSTGFCADQQ